MRSHWSWLLFILLPLTSLGRPDGGISAVHAPGARRVQSEVGARLRQQLEWTLKRRTFQSARRMLQHAQVPFEPEVLLEPNWREEVAPRLWLMPEMQTIRYETEPLAGVYLADTLYLPERVELAGETILLVRHLIFEGTQAVIEGNHQIYLFPIETMGLLGTPLRKATGEGRTWIRPVSVGTSALPVMRGGQIIIDTSGPGRKEWLEWRRRVSEGANRRVAWAQETRDTSGRPGADGTPGNSGEDGGDGQPGTRGADGVCGANVHGGDGGRGGNGTPGGDGQRGGDGNPGEDAKDIVLDIAPGTTVSYTLIARGGDGGNGGTGGNGGRGGNGGAGGDGGDGADCLCSEGGAGNGGRGGDNGWGGDGGNGGTGGNGGNGGNSGNIYVFYPRGYDIGKISAIKNNAGIGGRGGYGGAAGRPGIGGVGGKGGKGATGFLCPSSRGRDGQFGDPGSGGAGGDGGAAGNPGANGQSGIVAFLLRSGRDEDGDGWTTEERDCNDGDPAVNPGATEGGGALNCEEFFSGEGGMLRWGGQRLRRAGRWGGYRL